MNHRPERVGKLIREELSKMIGRELEFPDMLVTLMEADVSAKMDIAKIGISVIPSDKSEEALTILKDAQGELQYKLLRVLNIKPMPHLHFFIDYGPENAARVEKQLLEDERIEKERRGE